MLPSDCFRLAFERASDAMFVIAPDGRLGAVNRCAYAMLDYTLGALDGVAATAVLRDDGLVRRDNSVVAAAFTRERTADGHVLVVARAVDRRELDTVRESLRSLVNALPSPAFIIDRDHTVVVCNAALARNLHRRVEEVTGQNVLSFLPPELAAARSRFIADVFTTGAPASFDDQNGGRHYRNYVYPIVADGGVERVAVFAIDLSEVRRAEAELRASEERMRATIDGRPDVAVQWYNRAGQVLLWNHASERMFGFRADEALGKTLVELIYTPEQQAEFIETLAGIEVRGDIIGPVELPFRRRDGSVGTCLSTMYAIPGDAGEPYFVCMDVDLTERKRVESELRQAQKEEVLGRLAGGMAHDFNNLLTAIVGFAELGLARVPRGSEPSECFDFVLQAAQRGAALTGNLLAFARKKVVAPRSVKPREVVDKMLPLMRPLIGEAIELVTEHDVGPEHVTIDVGSFEQVIMNLAVNARDAMAGGGRLLITTRAVDVAADECQAVTTGGFVSVPPGRYVRLRVTDNGSGVPPDVHLRVFEPFFTTKSVGQGTGLGLATCASVVRQAGGFIGLTSSSSGTTFEVHLPVAPAFANPVTRDGKTHARGDETVLMVDDEPSVRVLMQRVLRSLGYDVLVASDGREALELAARHPGPVHLLLTDLVMPEMGGLELAQALKRTRPETKVLLCSGYASDPELVAENYALLPKPYTPSLLAQRVRETLDGG